MEKKYISPALSIVQVETSNLLENFSNGQFGGGGGNTSGGGVIVNGKEFDFVTEGEQAWKNEYPAFSLWED